MTSNLRRSLAVVAALLPSLATRPAAAPAWSIVQSPNFILLGDAGERPLHDVALRLEQFRAVIARVLPRAKVSVAVPTVVVVFGSTKSYEPFQPRYGGKAVRVGGYFVQGSDENYVTITTDTADDGFKIVCHEYTHFLIGHALSSAPVWLNEGLAEFYSTFALNADGKGAFIGRGIPEHIFTLRERFIPLNEVMSVDRSSPLYNEGDRRSIFYAESWAFVHYVLMEMPDGAERVNKYVGFVAAGQPVDRAFPAAFGSELREFEGQLRNYVRRSIYKSLQFKFSERVAAERGGSARPLSAAEVEAWLGDLLLHLNRPDEARARLDKALALDQNVARAHLSLGLLALREDRSSDAWRELQKAVSLDARNMVAQYAFGVAVLQHRGKGTAADAAPPLDAARTALLAALALEPEFSDALAALGYADLLEDAHLDEARTAVARAVALEPGRLDYAVRLAEICIRQNDYAEARRLLTPLASAIDEAGTAQHARSLLNTVEAVSRGGSAMGTSGGQRVLFSFRQIRAGERRIYGRLESIECGPGEIAFQVTETGGSRQRFVAKRIEDIEIITYREDLKGIIPCGGRDPADAVFLTSADENRAVAVEFLPKDYVPNR
jgi:tetratricopeptide (TPR) repeat protein